ncbi:MAG TPA: SMP-30/gluconolactonase/LRE family protein, partial [Mycobacterium sp.]|nr:SMP-30/gluconolactonase/LRE family protein [Mycobacterium sp.]
MLVVDDGGQFEVVVETEGPSGLGWFPDGRLVISTLGKPHLLVVDGGEVTILHDLSELGWSLNDVVVGPNGRIYVDVYRSREANQTPSGIVVATEDRWRIVAHDLATPNGLVITPDGSTLIVSDTFSGKIHAFTITDDGGLADQRVFADLGADRRPEGICLDAEGALRVGSFETSEFLRVREGGEITHRIKTPGRWAIATALGGADRPAGWTPRRDRPDRDGLQAFDQGSDREDQAPVADQVVR